MTAHPLPAPPGTVRLGDHNYPFAFLLMSNTAPFETVLALDEQDRLGYLAPSDEWTDGAEPLPELFQHAADELLAEGALSEKFNEFRKEPRS